MAWDLIIPLALIVLAALVLITLGRRGVGT
jgi:hypothetical protein